MKILLSLFSQWLIAFAALAVLLGMYTACFALAQAIMEAAFGPFGVHTWP